MTLGNLPGVMPFVTSGQLRVLGVASPARSPLLPDAATVAQTVIWLWRALAQWVVVAKTSGAQID